MNSVTHPLRREDTGGPARALGRTVHVFENARSKKKEDVGGEKKESAEETAKDVLIQF